MARLARRNMRQRGGVTLIEMLVAMAISLIMMAAVANLFAVVGSSVSTSRALINLSEQLRNARNLLQNDLAGITAPTVPPLRPENGDGYLEIFEGITTDFTNFGNTGGPGGFGAVGIAVDTLTGDPDDVLMFTTRSKTGQPFVGKVWNTNLTPNAFSTVESQNAEVVWFAVQNGRTIPITDVNGNIPKTGLTTITLYTLYRRMLLVAPEYNNTLIFTTANSGTSPFFYANDLSAHFANPAGGGNNVMVLNSMSDLTKRENRFAHDGGSAHWATYMAPLLLNPPPGPTLAALASNPPGLQALVPLSAKPPANSVATVSRVGEDVVLNNVLAFDVKVFDPTVPLYAATTANPNTVALQPSDVGYWTAITSGNSVLGYGAYVDLGYSFIHNGTNGNSAFSGAQFSANPLSQAFANGLGVWVASSYQNATLPSQLSGTPTTAFGNSYDTWSLHYEGPGPWNSYTNYGSTNGINGFDDDGLNGVDDPGEFQFPPPYAAPLRGIQVKIRVYEPDSKQIREVTIVQDLLP